MPEVADILLCLKWPTIFFPNVQESSDPVLLFFFFAFCGCRRAGDLSLTTFRIQDFSWRLRVCSLVVSVTLLQPCGPSWQKLLSSHEVSPRLTRSAILCPHEDVCSKQIGRYKAAEIGNRVDAPHPSKATRTACAQQIALRQIWQTQCSRVPVDQEGVAFNLAILFQSP